MLSHQKNEKMNKYSNLTPHICILMSTYNGEKYLAEQLQSIENQTHINWRLIISDDGSTDDTLNIAKQFQEKWGYNRLEIRQGPRKGFCQNFLSMACDPNIRADLYAFSDQDDVWMTDKLSRAIIFFLSRNQNKVTLYATRTEIVDENLKHLGYSPEFSLPKSFRNAIVQSIAGGNTMVFNFTTKVFLEEANVIDAVSHDWWLYQIVSGSGGSIIYDTRPSLLYRQHDSSLIGNNNSFRAKADRVVLVLNGRLKEWNTINIAALKRVEHLLTNDNREVLNIFDVFRQASFLDRIRLFEVCGLYRQTWKSTFNLWLAAIFNKV